MRSSTCYPQLPECSEESQCNRFLAARHQPRSDNRVFRHQLHCLGAGDDQVSFGYELNRVHTSLAVLSAALRTCFIKEGLSVSN